MPSKSHGGLREPSASAHMASYSPEFLATLKEQASRFVGDEMGPRFASLLVIGTFRPLPGELPEDLAASYDHIRFRHQMW